MKILDHLEEWVIASMLLAMTGADLLAGCFALCF
jgi:hypothetical protein